MKTPKHLSATQLQPKNSKKNATRDIDQGISRKEITAIFMLSIKNYNTYKITNGRGYV